MKKFSVSVAYVVEVVYEVVVDDDSAEWLGDNLEEELENWVCELPVEFDEPLMARKINEDHFTLDSVYVSSASLEYRTLTVDEMVVHSNKD